MREKAIETLSILRNSFLLESAIYDVEFEEAENSEVAKELEWVINELKQNPSRLKGKWQKPPRAKAYGRFCTVCHAKCWNVLRNKEYNYCPNCGAEMEDEE